MSGAAYYELKPLAAAQEEGADAGRCVLVVYHRKGNGPYLHDLAAGLAKLVLFREPHEGEVSALSRAAFRGRGQRLLSHTLTPDDAILHFQG